MSTPNSANRPIVPWVADIDIPESLATALIADQFENLRGLSVKRFGEGWDNVVFSVGGDWLIRLPHRKRAIDGVRREIACLPYIGPVVPIPVPNPTLVGSPSVRYPWPFFGYRKIAGVEANELVWGPDKWNRIVTPLARSLRALHFSPRLKELSNSLPLDPFKRLDFSYRSPWGEVLLNELHEAGEELPFEELSGYLLKASTIATPRASTLVHGDLYFRNILVNDRGSLTGIIDWGKIHRGNRAIDLQLYWSFVPPESRSIFVEQYGSIDADELALARGVAVWLNAVVLQHARSRGLGNVAMAARRALHVTAMELPKAP